jgi:hypothetical protein
MKIVLETISRSEQRYDTVGDWFTDADGVAHIRITNSFDRRYAWLLMLHELVEFILCQQRGISQESVDKWDMEWKDEGEPGDHPNAPYYHEHQFAEVLERYLASELDVDWGEYERSFES